ncbi:hypothetical protein IAT40_003319 [Kwoniella sp. CBS 6097]
MPPHTYPAGQGSSSTRLSKGKPGPQPLFLGSGQSSMYLSPVQEARIKSWAAGASTATPPAHDPKHKKKISKSAPASVSLSKPGSSSQGSNCTCTCTCTVCAASNGSGGISRAPTYVEGCPTCVGQSYNGRGDDRDPNCSYCQSLILDRDRRGETKNAGPGPNANVKGYYSSSRKQTGSNMTKTLPVMMTVRPKTPPRALRNPALALRMATFRKPDPDHDQITGGSGSGSPSSPVCPGPQQGRAYEAGSPPPIQWAPAPGQEVPVRQMAIPKAPQAPNLPRIAGVRDPISTNYYRNMFPPQGMGFVPDAPAMAPEMMPHGRWDLASKAPNSAMRGR